MSDTPGTRDAYASKNLRVKKAYRETFRPKMEKIIMDLESI